MALGIDTTRAFRFHDEIVRLVEAVIAAGKSDESSWIEWKSTLDLSKESAFQHLPRTVLGFANREPASAVRNAEGYAYLIIGAEPGGVDGITPIDPGDLSSRLRAYIGERITWHPEHVRIQGKDVLVITVDPPRPGDTIHVLLKPLRNIQPGEVFARHAGQSIKAGPAYHEMLVNRAKAGANVLDISVGRWGTHAIERAPELEPLTSVRVEEMRRRLLDAVTGHSVHRLPGPAASMSLADLIGGTVSVDVEKYAEDVEIYLNNWTRAVRARRDMLFERHAASHLAVIVRNNTDRNYLALQVNLAIPGARSIDRHDRRWPSLPTEPVPSVRTRNGSMPLAELFGSSGMPRLSGSFIPYLPDVACETVNLGAPEKKLRKTQGPDGVLVEYPELDLRPRQEHLLRSVCLDVRDLDVDSVRVRWDVTAKNADGRLEGEIPLPVTASMLDLTEIFSDAAVPDL